MPFYNNLVFRFISTNKPASQQALLQIFVSKTIKYVTVRSLNVDLVYEKKNRSLVFSGSRKIPTLGSTIQWETRQASFPTGTVGPWVGIFLSPLSTNDGFYLSHMDKKTEIQTCVRERYNFNYQNKYNLAFPMSIQNSPIIDPGLLRVISST